MLKVPVIIFVCYFVFNLFCFTYTYFRALGLSYVVMQTAVENNYIPPSEKATLEAYCNTLSNSSDMCSNFRLKAENSSGNNTRQQYGRPFTAGISYTYRVIWPLMPYEQYNNYDPANMEYGRTAGFNGTDTTGGDINDSEIEARMSDQWHDISIPITIEYTVPGLKYYADLPY